MRVNDGTPKRLESLRPQSSLTPELLRLTDYGRHAEALDTFIGAVRTWADDEGRGRVTDQVDSDVSRSLEGAEAALRAARVSFRLYRPTVREEVDNLHDAVWLLRDTALPRFDSMLQQLDVAYGRLIEF